MESRCRGGGGGGGGGGGTPAGTVSFSKGIGQDKWIVDPDTNLTGRECFRCYSISRFCSVSNLFTILN